MAKPKIFVSHSTKDNAFATKLVNDLKAAGADAWMDVNDLGAGNFQQRISEALADCEWFLLVLTPNALSSDWVGMEVDAAIRLKHQKRVQELIFVKAAAFNQSELPALWGVFNIFDATRDYASAFGKVVKCVDLSPADAIAPTDIQLPTSVRLTRYANTRMHQGEPDLAFDAYAQAYLLDPNGYARTGMLEAINEMQAWKMHVEAEAALKRYKELIDIHGDSH